MYLGYMETENTRRDMSRRHHMELAKSYAEHVENVAGSPDERSIPYMLGGILHALIAIGEGQS